MSLKVLEARFKTNACNAMSCKYDTIGPVSSCCEQKNAQDVLQAEQKHMMHLILTTKYDDLDLQPRLSIAGERKIDS